MKCDYKLCATQMTVPNLTITVGDVKAGAYWGNYCSYDCALAEFTHTWNHLKAGKPLATADTTNSTQVPTSTNAAPQAQVGVGGGMVGGGAMTVQAPADPPVTAPNEAPAPIAEDGMAWGGGDPAPTPAPENPMLNALQVADNYAATLAAQLASSFGSDCGVSETSLIDNGIAYDINKHEFTGKYNLFTYKVTVQPNIKDGYAVVLVSMPELGADYNATINHGSVSVELAVPPLVDHIKGAGKVVQEQGNTDQAQASEPTAF